MRSIAQALIAATLIASTSMPIGAQRSNGDGESGNRDALRALASLQVVHSASLVGRASPAFADWICAVHQMNPAKSDNSQDWKISYLANCSATTTVFAGARSGRSEGDWVFRFLGASGTGALNQGGKGNQGENDEDGSSSLISVPNGAGSSVSAGGITGGASSANSNGELSSAASGNTAVVTETITNPEPSTILLVSSGLAMLGASAFRRRRS